MSIMTCPDCGEEYNDDEVYYDYVTIEGALKEINIPVTPCCGVPESR